MQIFSKHFSYKQPVSNDYRKQIFATKQARPSPNSNDFYEAEFPPTLPPSSYPHTSLSVPSLPLK